MPDLIACPSCSLKHTRRPNNLCPRCQTSTEGAEASVRTIAPGTASASSLPSLAGSRSGSSSSLGGLAQAARSKEIRSARGILLFVGILTFAVNAFLFTRAGAEVEEEIQRQIKALPADQEADPEKVEEFRTQVLGAVRMIYGGGALVGAIFIGLGIVVSQYPVPATVGGLVLYIGSTAVFGFLNPASLGQGILVKILIVAGLFKSMQAAIAHQKEEQAGAGAA